jgi:cation diffusion facilitator CzcD-associated flavoprotein CzcO
LYTLLNCDPRYRGYENASLVSSKQITSFSDFRLPLDHPDHLALPKYIKYLRHYARHFKLDDRIRLGCRVTRIIRDPTGGHIVEFVQSKVSPQAQIIHADFIAVCSGLHVIPSIPDIPGIENVLHPKISPADGITRQVYHSSAYKGRAQLTNRRVMILGTGETGHDLAYEAAKAGATEVTLCTRGGFAVIALAG